MRLNNLSFHSKLGLSGLLITIILGVLSAATLIGLLYSSADSGFNLPEMDKVQAKYSSSLLVGAMKTSMYQHVTVDEDIDLVADWVKQGAINNDFFRDEVMLVMENDCQSCHSRSSTMTGAIPSIPLSNYEDIKRYTERGFSWAHMAKVAHIHLLGIAMLMGIVTLILSISSYQNTIKMGLICVAWITLWLDISAWWLAKFSTSFAYLIALAGTIEIASIITICILCLFDLWFVIPAFFREKNNN